MKRVVVLVDGQNLYYSLQNIGILEKQIKWDYFFKSLITSEDELIRTYWFRPQKILDTYYTALNIRNQIAYKKYSIYDYKNTISTVSQDIKSQIEADALLVEGWIK